MLEMYHSKKLVLGKLTLEGLQMGCGVKNNVLYFNDLINSLAYLRRHDGKHV